MGKEQVNIQVTTKREKANAAAELGHIIIDMGFSDRFASDKAIHELKHALAHRGTGIMGLEVRPLLGGELIVANYKPDNPDILSKRDLKLIAEAPGRGMSITDRIFSFLLTIR